MIAPGTLDQGLREYVLTLGASTVNYAVNLRDWFVDQHPTVTGKVKVRFVLESNALVYGTISNWAMTTSIAWPAGSTLTLDMPGGVIAGFGGRGGAGAVFDYQQGGDGDDGQLALEVLYPITINNTGGIISGGGGGGGGGGAGQDGFLRGAGGGGGGGSMIGYGGIGGVGSGVASGTNGAAATTSQTGANGGIGGRSAVGPDFGQGGTGGKGGDLGQAGSPGGTGSGEDFSSGGAGGAVGPAVGGNSMVTWLTVGDVRGALIP